jgi:hypothetical protein
MAPEYLRHLVPPTIQSTTIYPLRNGDNLIVPFCRLSITNSSFIPSTVKEWNKLDIAIRKLDSLSKFKNAIRLNSQGYIVTCSHHDIEENTYLALNNNN